MKKIVLSVCLISIFIFPIMTNAATQEEVRQQLITTLEQMIVQIQQQIAQILASQNFSQIGNQSTGMKNVIVIGSQNDPNSANCVPEWQCSGWSQICKLITNPKYNPYGTQNNNLQMKVFEQTRNCIDLNKCLIVSDEDMPITTQIVDYCPSYLPE